MKKHDNNHLEELLWEMSGQKAATGRTWAEQKRFNRKIYWWRARQILILLLPYLPLIAAFGINFHTRPLEGVFTFGIILIFVFLAWIALSTIFLVCSLIAIKIRLWFADAWGDNDFFGMYHSIDKNIRNNLITETAVSLSTFILYSGILIIIYRAIFAGKFR